MLPFLGSRGSRRLRLGALLVTASAAVGSCLGDASGPEGLTGYFALAPSFESGHARLIPLAQARVTLERSGQTTPAIDTIVPIQPGDSTVDLSFNVVLLSANETFLLTIKLISPAGDTVFQAGPIPVTAGTDPSSVVPIDVTFVYTGTGADAAGVRILTPDTTVIAGDEVLLTAEAFDDNESPLPGTPIGWASGDPSKAQVADETLGLVLAGAERGTARITATLLTGQADTALITIQLPPAALVAESGSGQSGPAGSLLPDPLVARLTASDGGGVVNERVQFAVVTGGGALSATSALTDAEGRASVQWTLGGTGAQLVEATTARLPGVTAAFTATTEAPGLIIVDGDGQSALVGAAVAIAPTVRVTDPQGNSLPDVAVTFAVTAGGGSVTGANALTDANGLAAVGSWVLGPAVGLNSLTASAQSFDPVTFSASATGPGGATSMTLEAGDGQTAVAGTAVPEAPAVLVTDGSGNAVVDVTVNFAVTAGGGTLEFSDPVTDANGIASVGTWTLGSAGANEVTASLLGLPDVVFTATGTLGAADAVVIVSGNDQSADAGTQLPAPLVVEVQDAGGNPVQGETVTWDTQTGSLSPTTGTTNAAGRTQTLWTLDPGIVTHTATATVEGLTPAVFTATALFPNPTILLDLASGSDRIVVGGTETLDITLTAPAPAGGVDVDIFSDNPAVVAVETAFVTIPEGQTTGQGLLTGVTGGASTVRASAQNYAEGTLLVTVSVQVLSLPVTLNVPFGGTASLPVQISTPAPAGGVDVTLVSDNPAAVEVLTPTVTIPEGSQTANGSVLGVAPGTATVTGTTTDYGTAQSTVSTTASLNIVRSSTTIYETLSDDVTIQLESGGLPIPAPTGGIDVTLTPRDPTCVAAVSPVTILGGLVSTTSSVSYGGSATLTCTTQVVADAPNSEPDSVSVTVNPAPGFTLYALTVGSGLQRSWNGYLDVSNHGGVDVVVTSNDPTVALVSPNASTPGTASITLPIADGQTFIGYYVQGVEGVADTGTAITTFTVTAPGFTTDSVTKTVVRPGIDIVGLNVNTTSLSAEDPFWIRVGVPNGAGTFLNDVQAIRAGGNPITVDVTSSDLLVGQLVTASDTGGAVTVDVAVGAFNSPTSVATGGVAFDPLGAGTTVVTASNQAFTTMSSSGTYTVTVTAPSITLSPITVGAGLQRSWSGSLGASNHGGVNVVVQSDDPTLALVSPNVSTPGATSITVFVPDGQTIFSYYVQGVEDVPDTTTTFTAFELDGERFIPGTAMKTIVRPAFDLAGLNTSSTTLSPDDPFVVRTGIPNGSLTFLTELQAVRAGGNPVTATVTSSDPPGQLVTASDTGRTVTVEIAAGSFGSATSVAAGGVAFDPVTAGGTTVTATNPAFTTVTTTGILTVTITAPGINISPATVGAGLQRFWSGTLGASAHGGVDVVITSDDPAIAQVSPDASTAGANSITVVVPDGQTFFSYYVQGVEGVADTGTAATTFTVTASGFTTTSVTKTIVRPGIDISGLANSTTTLSSDDVFNVRVGVPNTAGTFLNELQAVRAGSNPIGLTVTSSNSGVGQLVTSTVTAGAVTVEIPAGDYQTPFGVATGGVAFDPLTAGTTVVTASHPAFTTMPLTGIDTVTVTAPGFNMYPITVGAGLQRSWNANLEAPEHGGVDVVIKSSNPGVALVAPDASTPGTDSIVISLPDGSTFLPYYVQGVEGQTGTVTFSARATGFIDGSTTKTIVQPALDISGLLTSPTAGATDDPFVVRLGVPNTSLQFLNELQAVRAGASPISVTVSSSDATVGQLVTTAVTGGSVTVEIAVGAVQSPTAVSIGGVAFTPLAAGTTTVTADATAAGVLTTTSNGIRTVTVQ